MKVQTKLLMILVVVTISTGIVIALHALSNDIRTKPGSFSRLFPPHPVVEAGSLELEHDAYYFAGGQADRIYLAHRRASRHVLRINTQLTDTAFVTLELPGLEQHKSFRIEVRVDSPYFYFMDGTAPYVYRGLTTDWRGRNILNDSVYFITGLPVSPTALAIRAFSNRTLEDELGIKRYALQDAQLAPELLQKQLDGSFCVSGSIVYSKYLHQLIYVYQFRNEYLLADTNLTLTYRAHTLDTFSRANVKIDTLPNGRVKLSAPPFTINKRAVTFKNFLLVHSQVASRNERPEDFNRASVIDVYDLLNRSYTFSFYLPHDSGKPVKDLLVHQNNLYVLFDHRLKRYEMLARYFGPAHNDTIPVSQE